MNERVKELYNQCLVYHEHPEVAEEPRRPAGFDSNKFAELIVREHIDLLQREWYELNNAMRPADETARDVGMRVGRKGEVIVLIEKIKKHFGVEQ